MYQVITAPPGHRNFTIAFWGVLLIAWQSYLSGDQLPQMSAVFTAELLGLGSIIAGRALNKKVENGKKGD